MKCTTTRPEQQPQSEHRPATLLIADNDTPQQQQQLSAQYTSIGTNTPTDSFPSKISLNVGGTLFTTSLSTLRSQPDTFFAAMFAERWQQKAEADDGAFFIDRDPAMFRHVLNCMRGQCCHVEQMCVKEREALLQEAEFYGLTSLIEELLQARGGFLPDPKCKLSHNYTHIRSLEGTYSETQVRLIQGARQYIGPGVFKWRVRIVDIASRRLKFNAVSVGVVASQTQNATISLSEIRDTPLWLVSAGFGGSGGWLYSGPPDCMRGVHYHPDAVFGEGDVITVQLNLHAGTLAFTFNCTEAGVAFRNVPTDMPLSPCVALRYGVEVAIEEEMRQ